MTERLAFHQKTSFTPLSHQTNETDIKLDSNNLGIIKVVIQDMKPLKRVFCEILLALSITVSGSLFYIVQLNSSTLPPKGT